MATPSGGKFRSKRSHYARKPYERPKPKSLLARVSDTVKDFITPSWLNNLWTNPNDDDGEGSSRSSTPELPQPDAQPAGTPNFMPSAVATSTPDINLRIGGKEALSMPGPSSMETTPIVQLREDVVRDGGRNDDDDVVIISEGQPSTSKGIKHTPLPFRNYANPIGTSTPNEDMQLLGGRKQVLDKDDASDTSVSTSGCSSLVPHVDRVDHREKLSKKNLDRLSEMGHSNSLAKSSLWTDMSSTGPSGATAGLWTDMSSAGPSGAPAGLSTSRPQQAVSAAKRPSFNSSYFGSPKLVGEPRPKHASPFYPGRTQFGGSSAQRTGLKRHRDSPYEVHLPVKRNIRPKPAQLNLQDSLGATSSTAKKILDTLERMSTPLLDAKKMPLSPTASPYSFRPTSRLSSRPGTSRTNTPPTSGLRVAHQASIKPNRQPPVSMVIDLEEERVSVPSRAELLPTSTAAPTISTAPSFRFGAPLTSSTPAVSAFNEGTTTSREKTGGKMKSKSRTTMHYSAQKAEEEVCEIPDLPEVALPLPKGLPTFSFGSSLTSKTSSSITKPSSQLSTAAASTKNVSLASSSSSSSRSSSSKTTSAQSSTVPSFQFASPMSKSSSEGPQFTFASPIIKQAGSSSTLSSLNSSSNVTTFKFSNPRQTPYSTSKPSANAPLGGQKPSFETPERTRRKDDDDEVVEVRDDEEEDEGGIKVARELKTGSCLEAFGIRPTKNGPIPSSSSKVQAHPAKVSSTKMDNGPLTASPSKKPAASNLQKQLSNSLFNKFKPAASSWECDTCMIQNNGDASKCVACLTPKPGQKASKPATSTAVVGGPSNSLFNKFKPAANSWECDACMIQNSGDASKCVACATPKPGQSSLKPATSSISDSKPSPVFNSLGNKFSKQSNEWECDTCMLQNKDSVEKCVACTTPRPGKSKGVAKAHVVNNVLADKFKTSAGEWECDTCMIRNKATILKCVACETPKPGSQPALSAPPASSFKFGNTSLSNGDATGAFKFGNSATSDTLNSNTNASGGGFKLPAGLSLGQSLKPASLDSNGTPSSSGGGFKLPANMSLSKPTSNSSTSKTTAASEVKSLESSLLGKAKSEQKLEVKVPGGMKFGASSSESSNTSGGFKFGAGAPSGGLTFGQSDASSKSNSSSSIGGGFKFGQSPATAGQTLLDKEGPPPNVNIFQSNATEGDGPAAKKSFSFGATAPSTAGTSEKKIDGAAVPSFKFGGSSSSTKEPTLNAESPVVQFGAGAVTFGGAKVTDSSVKPAESKPSFSFGSTSSSSANSLQPTSASTTPSFNFGNSSSASKPDSARASSTDSKPGFQFGSTVPSQAAGSGLGFGAKPQEPATSSAGSFTFGQTAAAAPEKTASAPSFNFGATTPSPPTVAATKEEPAKPAGFMFGSQNQNNNQGGGSSGFSFGAPAASSAAQAQTTASFNFGTANKAPAAAAPSAGGFNFGATPNSTTQFTGSSTTSGFGGFGSNRSSTNPSPAFGAPPTATQPPSSFAFGSTAPTTSATSNPFGGSTPKANATTFGGQAANPTFGSASGQSQGFGASAPNQASVFGSNTNTTTNSTFGSGLGAATGAPAFGASTNATPGFGNKPTPAFGSGTANAAPGGFQFGKAAPGFNFGATNNATPAAPAQGFQFTGNQPNQTPQVAPAATPQPAGGFNFAGAGQPSSFNFGASTPQAGATAYQFQASGGATESNPFSASATPGAQSGRKIKRAVRRNAKR